MNDQSKMDEIFSGAVSVFTEEGLRGRLLSGKTLKIKLGADPSRPDLHLGHSVVLRKLKLFQELGHEVIFVVGDFTAMIGDPTGKSKTRPALSLEQTRKSGETYLRQAGKILDPERTKVLFNSAWLDRLSFSDVISLASKTTLARMMERNDFLARYTLNQPLGLHELLYPLAQGYDSVAIGSDVEVGGTDQTFNLLVGRTLQSQYGQPPQEVITYPLLVGLDGTEKMSKSLGNYIGIDEPPEAMFEKAMRIPDRLLEDYFVLTAGYSRQQARDTAKNPYEAHYVYARLIVAMYHGRKSAEEAETRYRQVAAGGRPERMPVLELPEPSQSLCQLLLLAGFAASKSEARRCIAGRGIRINGAVAEDPDLPIDLTRPVILQFGKNRFVKIVCKAAQS